MKKRVVSAILVLTVLVFSAAFQTYLTKAQSQQVIAPSKFSNAQKAVDDGDIELGATSSQARDYWPTADWRTSSPEEQGMNSAKLDEMMQYIKSHNFAIGSVVVVRNGYVVLDEYPNPAVYGRDSVHQLYSVTKSFSSALIGIVIEEGFIDGAQRGVLGFFPDRTFDNVYSRKQVITLEHLLTMASGLPWDEQTYPYGNSRNDVTRMMSSVDPVQFVLDRPMVSEPGAEWVYNSGGSHLLSAIIKETTGNDTLSLAMEHLFDPLGISTLYWERARLSSFLSVRLLSSVF